MSRSRCKNEDEKVAKVGMNFFLILYFMGKLQKIVAEVLFRH